MGAGLAVDSSAPRSVGRYILCGEIAAGGMATVHYGRLVGPAGFSRAVAIKRLHPQLARNPEFVAMFLEEARVAAHIVHPNVVPTLDIVASDGELFLVMEYVRGMPLSRLLRKTVERGVPFTPRISASIVAGMLHGLHAAHEVKDDAGSPLHIVHRDVSPQNVLVDVEGVARVVDFGIARTAAGSPTTRDGLVKGKLGYVAPEVIRGERPTRRVDVFAAGVVLWEALAGARLFKADNDATIIAEVLRGHIPPVSELVEGVPRAVDDVIARAAAPNPRARFVTARAMAEALEAALPLASQDEVGGWVARVAGPELRRRSLRVAAIERATVAEVLTRTSEAGEWVAGAEPYLGRYPSRPVARERGDVAGVVTTLAASPRAHRTRRRAARAVAGVIGLSVGVVATVLLRASLGAGDPISSPAGAPPPGVSDAVLASKGAPALPAEAMMSMAVAPAGASASASSQPAPAPPASALPRARPAKAR